MQNENAAMLFFKKYNLGEKIFENLLSSVGSAEKKFSHNLFAETVTADDSFIREIESALFSLERIVKNPQRFIAEESEVVQIEKVKKITPRSIQHLSANSSFIREVNDDGSVIPSKLLSTFMEEDLLIHENRFVYTLILRLLTFLEMRRDYTQKNIGSFETEKLNINALFEFGGADIEYDLNVKIKKPTERDDKSFKAETTVAGINRLYNRVRALKGSEFFRSLSKTRPLSPPIAKTNLLTKHKDYSTCYKLWLYLYSLTSIGVSVDVDEIDTQLSENYFDDLTYTAAMSLKVVLDNISGVDTEKSTEELPGRSYDLITDFDYIPDYSNDLVGVQDDYINEYYFKKISRLLREEKDPLSFDGPEEAENKTILLKHTYNISMPFTRFYRKLAAINAAMYDEYLHYNLKVSHTPTDKKGIADTIADNKELLRRCNLLCRLKEIELEQTRRRMTNIEGRINVLQHELKAFDKKDMDKNAGIRSAVNDGE